MAVYEFLRKVPLFADLADEDLARACEIAEELRLKAGQVLFREGDAGTACYVIREGELEVVKASEGREVLLAVRNAGDVIGEMSLLEESPRMAGARARTDAALIRLSQVGLDLLLERSPSAARALLHTVLGRLRTTEARVRQSEKMAQLGRMTAGLAHELNNPAAAVQRSAKQLAETDGKRLDAEATLDALGVTTAERSSLTASVTRARARLPSASDLDPLERSDREAEIEAWLEERGCGEAWEIAPILVGHGLALEDVEAMAAEVDATRTSAAVAYVARQLAFHALLDEVLTGATRISSLVQALKRYTYLDQAPVQDVDVHEGLESTLVILRAKLADGIRVRREYAADLPRITAYGTELNQVWTNLIDNAADAMNGKGQLVLETSVLDAGQSVQVRVIDDGPGIPDDVKSKIFDPFFTTKPPGQGTGLGLDISYNIVVNRHRGELSVTSRPGKTAFCVRLPLRPDAPTPSAAPGPVHPSDETLREILRTTRTIAVVGASTRADAPGHTVPLYLQAHGYRIIPVNPNVDELFAERAYPSVDALSEAPDLVLLFRSEDVRAVVEEAIAKGAKVVWMQEGIVDEEAAVRARDAGLVVAMDLCMRKAHGRLLHD